MRLELKRDLGTAHSTPGRLYVDGRYECFTLEDVVRPTKIKGETAIPVGTYRVVLTHSPRFGRVLPLLMNVPDYEGIRIHPGNTDKDTEGCILVGDVRQADFVGTSRVAFERLLNKLRATTGPITITVSGAR